MHPEPLTTDDPGSSGAPRVRRTSRRVAAIAGGLLLCWVIVEGITLPFVGIARLGSTNPSETAFMRLRAEEAKEGRRPVRRMHAWVPLRSIPTDLVNAVVVAEDGTFWTHGGFDWFELKESVVRNISERRAARGASTITQQLVKNLYLSPSKNPLRKIREWVLTWWMERKLSKARILELYLNVIEWGDGVYGVQAASRLYFGKDVSLLSRDEAVRLAAVIPSPRRHRPDDNSRFVSRRTEQILARMAARGM